MDLFKLHCKMRLNRKEGKVCCSCKNLAHFLLILQRELEKVKRRRLEREKEKEIRDKEREMEQREKETNYYSAWEKQEDTVSPFKSVTKGDWGANTTDPSYVAQIILAVLL